MPQTSGDLDKWSRDWRRLKAQKSRARGGVESSMLLDFLLYHGETQSIQVQNTIVSRAFRHSRDKNKLRLLIPLAQRLADRKIGRHWSIAHRFKATPNTTDPIAYDHADVIGDQLIPALDFKAQQDTLRWLLYYWQVLCGVVFEHCDWKEGVTQDVLPKYDEQGNMLWKDALTGAEIPEAQVALLLQRSNVVMERFSPATEVQTAGDFGSDIYDPFRVFVDASVKQVKMLGPDQRIYLADIRTFEWIRDTFGNKATARLKPSENLSIMNTQLMDRGIPVSGINLKDLLPEVQGSHDKDDPEMCVVLTMYQPPSTNFPEGVRSFFVPDQRVLNADDNPYPEVPVIDWHWGAPGATMWTPGFMRALQALSRFINKRFSQMGEAANAQIYEMLLLGGTLAKKDIPTDFPGVVEDAIGENGEPLVQVVPRGNLPAFFPDSIRLSMETLDALGSSDLMSQRKFPGQLRGPLAIPMLQELLDSEDGPRFSHIAEQFALEKMMRVNRIKAFYPPIRTLQYTGDDLRSEVLEFHTDEILRAGVDFTVTADPGSIMPELSSMREARVRERMQWAPGLYTNARTGTIDWSKVGKDLKYNDRQREASENRGRKLARQVLQWVRKGRLTVVETQGEVDPATGKPKPPQLVLDESRPFVVMPFWNHGAMMDEYQDKMETTEFLEASPAFVRTMMVLYESHRQILAQMDAARQQSVDNKMVQNAMAQAASQSAAKAASVATDVAIDQVMAQMGPGGDTFGQLQGMVRALVGEAQAQGTEAGGSGMRRQLPIAPGGRRRLVPGTPGL